MNTIPELKFRKLSKSVVGLPNVVLAAYVKKHLISLDDWGMSDWVALPREAYLEFFQMGIFREFDLWFFNSRAEVNRSVDTAHARMQLAEQPRFRKLSYYIENPDKL
jgi:hypothetical protein